jgi:Zn-ribbon-containing, possibly nucleic-acid-binding protein (DUF2310)
VQPVGSLGMRVITGYKTYMEAYNKLRPITEIESCTCDTVTGLLLVDMMSDNPLHCATCLHEVDPARINLTESETDDIASWYPAARSLYRLWLDSGEYEAYAKNCLVDADGQINRVGRQLAKSLSAHHPTVFWFFHDADDGTPTHCPYCDAELDTNVKWGTGACRACHILM